MRCSSASSTSEPAIALSAGTSGGVELRAGWRLRLRERVAAPRGRRDLLPRAGVRVRDDLDPPRRDALRLEVRLGSSV